MKKSLLLLFIIFCTSNSMHKSIQNGATVEEIIELLYEYHLINKIRQNSPLIHTNYKFIVHQKDYKPKVVIPTFYQLSFNIQNNQDGTYYLHTTFNPVQLSVDQAKLILKESEQKQVYKEQDNIACYVADFMLRIIIAYTDTITHNVENNQERLEIREVKVKQHPWFTVTPYTVCCAIDNALYPQFMCKTRISESYLNRIHSYVS